MKSIKTKMMIFFGIITIIVSLGSGWASYNNSLKALESNLDVMLPEIAKQTAGNLQSKVDGELKALESIASRADIKDTSLSVQEKLKILAKEGERLGAIRMGMVSLEGDLLNTDGTTAQLKGTDYFERGVNGESLVVDPLVTPENDLVVPYIVPIMNDGKVTGLLLETKDGDALSQLTNSIKVGQNGTTFMINSEGVSIANPSPEKVLQQLSDIEAAKTDPSLEALAAIEKKMIAGETGTGVIEYQGIKKFMGYAPVEGTGWSVAVTMTQDEALSVLDNLKSMDIINTIVFTLISLIAVYFIANSIAKGIKLSSRHLKVLAEGNFTEEISPKYLNLKDEIGEMMRSMKTMQESIGKMIKKIRESSADINKQSESLSAVTKEIADSSQSVSETITEVAEGTNSQSDDLVLINDILDQFNHRLTNIIGDIEGIGASSREISAMATESSNETTLLNQSVTHVSHTFKEFYQRIIDLGEEINRISQITDLIKNIADQTNLLALNAAIEAARAGEEGRGFVVVADEIRKLAEQAKISSDNISKVVTGISEKTNSMIDNSVSMDHELLDQVAVIEKSMTSFQKIIGAIDEVVPKIETIQAAAQGIDEDKNRVIGRMEGISAVAEEISASSEEISAASEEVSASVQEVASAAVSLNQSTHHMLAEVERFKVE